MSSLPPYSLIQNRIAQRKNKTLKDMINATFLFKNKKKTLTKSYILNKVPLK